MLSIEDSEKYLDVIESEISKTTTFPRELSKIVLEYCYFEDPVSRKYKNILNHIGNLYYMNLYFHTMSELTYFNEEGQFFGVLNVEEWRRFRVEKFKVAMWLKTREYTSVSIWRSNVYYCLYNKVSDLNNNVRNLYVSTNFIQIDDEKWIFMHSGDLDMHLADLTHVQDDSEVEI